MAIPAQRSPKNYSKILGAFRQFKMPVFDMTEENFLHHQHWDVFTFGTPPVAIDLMVDVKGIDFEKCYVNAVLFEDGDLRIRTINKSDLIQAKKSSGRSKDLNDLENIE
jgi:hypothetical protein